MLIDKFSIEKLKRDLLNLDRGNFISWNFETIDFKNRRFDICVTDLFDYKFYKVNELFYLSDEVFENDFRDNPNGYLENIDMSIPRRLYSFPLHL